jgi:hypothetical protein
MASQSYQPIAREMGILGFNSVYDSNIIIIQIFERHYIYILHERHMISKELCTGVCFLLLVVKAWEWK